MSYCRFQNTLPDLRDCWQHLTDDCSEEEARARKHLIQICRDIVKDAKDEDWLEDE